MGLDIVAELGIDLVEHRLAVPERPHLADGLVADAHHDAADILHHRIHRTALVVPVLTVLGWLVADIVGLVGVGVDIGHDVAHRRLMGHVVDARAHVDDGLEGGMGGHVGNALAIDPDRAPVANRVAILVARSQHVPFSLRTTNPSVLDPGQVWLIAGHHQNIFILPIG